MTCLLAAESWGSPPWVIEAGPAIWLIRFAEMNNLRIKKQEQELASE